MSVQAQDSSLEATSESGEILTAEATQEAIKGAVDFLRDKQRSHGEWDEYPGYKPGTTSLCTLALLTAGLDKDDPTIAKALDYLREFSPAQQNQTYPVSLQTMVFCLADPEKDRQRIEANVAWLLERQMKTQNEHHGGWSYVGDHQASERSDNSNSQFAILALYEAELVGVHIEEEVWQSAEDYWLRMQNDDGSWGYRSSSLNPAGFASGYGTGSMTCAGIAALAICSGVREAARASAEGDNIRCCQDVDDPIAAHINRGLNWLGKHFKAHANPGRAEGSESYFFYYLYGLERVGRLTANRFVGQSDWYREGAEVLLRRKGAFSQFWVAQKDLGNNNCVSTSFALLFLSKGRWPILVSKLKYGQDQQWNQHPNDLAHLTQRVEKDWNLKLVWQTIDAKKATVSDLLQTPILALNGQVSPLPDNEAERARFIANLREYLEQGGFIFAEALDGDLSFESGFRELMRQVLGSENGELDLLGPDHPIWSAEKPLPAQYLRPIYGADFGCRTSVVFVPSYRPKPDAQGRAPSVFDDRPSLSCLWEAAQKRTRTGEHEEHASEKALAEIEAAFILGENIFAYATNRQLKFKDQISSDVAEELTKGSDVHNSLFVGVLECGGGNTCAPRAIPNLMKLVRSRLGVPAQLFVPRIKPDDDALFDYPTLFMHGRNQFQFSESERERLRDYFQRGGFLFVNAVCASKEFSDSFIEELTQILPDAELEDVPADDPVFTGRYGGFKIEKLQYRHRKVNAQGIGQTILTDAPPRLKGVKSQGRWILLFSPDDVSCALENVVSGNCDGLTQRSAFYLATNVLFYAAESF
ncbi:MAG: DUF4159 domain-containing protein [Planctomycetia bacterium]|nr:DUF4159 domain-containing protein [Planctomycetia bacterium]